MKRIKTFRWSTSEAPDTVEIERAAGLIRAGGVVLFPTRCLYGLGADALNKEAVDRVFQIKDRPPDNPILVLIGHVDELSRLAKRVPTAARKIMDRFWPGKVTIVFDALDRIPFNLTAGKGKIGVRLTGHPSASALVKAVNRPITGTSANVSGRPGCSNIAHLDPEIAGRIDLIIDAGPLKGGSGSTVVDVTGDRVRVLREGAVTEKDVLTVSG